MHEFVEQLLFNILHEKVFKDKKKYPAPTFEQRRRRRNELENKHLIAPEEKPNNEDIPSLSIHSKESFFKTSHRKFE